MSWTVKNYRPEEIYNSAEEYFNKENAQRYAKSSSMRRIQQKIALMITQLFLDKPGKILDVGCGPGFTMELFKEIGYEVEGIDIAKEMIKIAETKGLKVKEQDIRNLNEKEKYDFIISISAFQWLKRKEDMEKAAKNIYAALKEKGKAIIQFYPFSELELKNLENAMKKAGFRVEIHILNPQSKRKTLYFVVGWK